MFHAVHPPSATLFRAVSIVLAKAIPFAFGALQTSYQGSDIQKSIGIIGMPVLGFGR
jgi:hypothetical protein